MANEENVSGGKNEDTQLKVFCEDLNNLINSDESLHYLKERLEKLGEIDDYKKITQFFRIAAFDLQAKLIKAKKMALSFEKYDMKFESEKNTIAEKDAEIEKLNKDIEGFKEEFVKLRGKAENIAIEAADEIKKKIFAALIPVIDNIALAVKAKDTGADIKTVCDGFAFICEQVKKIFEKEGLKEVSCEGGKFDHKSQEIIQQVEDKTKESGTIIEETRKAYFYKDKLIRPAMVKIVK